MNQLQAAGYIVENGDAIWGKGATSDEAWQDFLARMKIANVEVVMELQTDAGGFPEPEQTVASDYRIIAATKPLLDKVERDGGAISCGWGNGVACTDEEKAA
jgi:hypothetical protein